MRPSEVRLVALAAAMALLIVAAAALYQFGMAVFEGQERGFWQALEWAGETLSTTGYGRDNTWTHPVMVLFVVGLQFVGLCLVFLVFPVYLLPALEERFQSRLPRSAPKFEQGILIFGWGPAVVSLADEIGRMGRTAVIVESDESRARTLMEEGRTVVHGELADNVLERLDLENVTAVVLNEKASESAAITLALRQDDFEGDIFALVEEPRHRKAISLAGADGVFTPRHILAAALAAQASDRVGPRVAGAQSLGERLMINEMKLDASSMIVGMSLREADVGLATGINVIGLWLHGDLIAPPPPDQPLEADSILIVAGEEEAIHRFAELADTRRPEPERTLFVAGHGEVGRTVAEILTTAGESVLTLDADEEAGADLVGDISDHDLLRSRELDRAKAVILAVGSDSATLLATLMVREIAPAVPIIARVNEASNVERMHRAGADFALSISQVSGQLLSKRLLGQEILSLDAQLKVLRTSGRAVAGRHPADLHIRRRTGASVVAIERGENLWTRLEEDFRFEEGDAVYICGSQEALDSYLEAFPEDTE